jgi:hypothetical protein
MEFSKWWVNEFKTVKFPAQGTVFNYYIDPETKRFLPWNEMVTTYSLDYSSPLQVNIKSLSCSPEFMLFEIEFFACMEFSVCLHKLLIE